MKVLVLETDPGAARALSRPLTFLGHEVHTAASAESARRLLQAGSAMDVIFASQHLGPGESGAAFLSWAAQHLPRALRVLMSCEPCPPGFVEQPGIQLFRSKPLWRPELEALLPAPESTPAREHVVQPLR